MKQSVFKRLCENLRKKYKQGPNNLDLPPDILIKALDPRFEMAPVQAFLSNTTHKLQRDGALIGPFIGDFKPLDLKDAFYLRNYRHYTDME